jgi:hypothetical protein
MIDRMKPPSQGRCAVCGMLLVVGVYVGTEILHSCHRHWLDRSPAVLPASAGVPPKDDRPYEWPPVAELFASRPVPVATTSEELPPGQRMASDDVVMLRWGLLRRYRQ